MSRLGSLSPPSDKPTSLYLLGSPSLWHCCWYTVHGEGKDNPGRLLPYIPRLYIIIPYCLRLWKLDPPCFYTNSQHDSSQSKQWKKLWSPWELLCCYHGLIETAGYTIFLNRRHPYRITFICVETNIYQAAPRNNKHFIYSVMPLSPYDQPGGYMLLPQIYKWEKITLGSWVTC